MSSKTVILQPSFHSSSRTEFRLDGSNKVLGAALRVCNFGCTTVTKTTPLTDPTPLYYLGTGIYGLIKQITLYSGTIVLDELRDANRWLGISNLMDETDHAWDVSQKTLCTGLNLQHQEFIQFPSLLELKPTQNKYIGMLHLQNVLPMLKNIGKVIDGKILPYLIDMQDLRLVIEYNTDVTSVFQSIGGIRPASFTVNQPVMVFDELTDEFLLPQLLTNDVITWKFPAIEREKVSIPATGNNASDNNSVRLRSMDQKQVNNVLLQIVPTGAADNQLGYSYSINMAQGDDKVNFVLNSKRLLPQNGLNTPARKAASVADAIPSGNMCVFTLAHDILSSQAATATGVYDARLQTLINKLAFVNCDLKDTVKQLDLEYARKALGLGVANPAVDIWVWSRVWKQGMRNVDGSVSTMYSVSK